MSNVFENDKMICANRIKLGLKLRDLKQTDLSNMTGIPKSAMSQYISGSFKPKQDRIYLIAKALNTSEAWIMGYNVPFEKDTNNSSPFPEPTINEDYATFKIIGNVAAGYNGIAEEQYDGDDIDIPISSLRGRPQSDFFVLRVKGQSMYPEYRDGDIVLILKTPTLEFSGDIGVVLYDGEMATLKKVEFVMGEDWMRLIPLNPAFETKTIKNEDLEQCQILGVPKLLIRPINNF